MHKPAGINKHFNVAIVSESLSQDLGRPVLACSIWKKLREMFDLKAVEDREETLPFSLEVMYQNINVINVINVCCKKR